MGLPAATAHRLSRSERWTEASSCDHCAMTLVSARPVDFSALMVLHQAGRAALGLRRRPPMPWSKDSSTSWNKFSAPSARCEAG
jgi:hypothetical protein